MRQLPILGGIVLLLCLLVGACGTAQSTTAPPSPELQTDIPTPITVTATTDAGQPASTPVSAEPTETKIYIDGDPSDWAGYEILISDPQGDHQKGGFDVSNVKALANDEYLYVMVESFGVRQDYTQVDLELRAGEHLFVVSFRTEEGGVGYMGEVTSGDWQDRGEVSGSVSAAGEVVEVKMPLAAFGYTGTLTLNSVRPMGGTGGEDWFAVDETSRVEVPVVNEFEPVSAEGEPTAPSERPQVCSSEIAPPVPFGELEPASFEFSGAGYQAEWFVAPGAFNMPHEILLTPEGELLVLSVRSQQLLRLDLDGTVTLLADQLQGYLGDVDQNGQVYLYDYPGGEIVRVSPQGSVSLVVKSPEIQAACDSGFAIGPDGNLYVALNACGRTAHLIQITPQGAISTKADGIPLMSALGTTPDGRLLGAGSTIYEISLEDYSVTTLEFNPSSGVSAGGMTFDDQGNIYLSNGSRSPSGEVYRLSPDGEMTRLAEIEDNGLSGIEWVPSTGEIVGGQLRQGGVIAVGAQGQIREIVPGNGIITPMGMAFSPCGELAVANDEGEMMALIDPAGVASLLFTYNSFTPPTSFVTFAPDGTLYASEGAPGMPERVRLLPVGGQLETLVQAEMPCGVAYRSDGTLFIAETSAGRITQVHPDGTQSIFVDGLHYPQDLVFDSQGMLYVVTGPADFVPEGVFNTPNDGDVILRISPEGAVTTLASLRGVTALAVDPADQLYAAFGGNVARIDPVGGVTPFGGGLVFIRGMAFDLAGYLYLADADMNGIARIRGFPQGTLSGVVKDGSGAPISGARVQVRSEWPVVVGQVVFTDDEGRFQVLAAPRTYSLTVSAGGLGGTTLESVQVNSGDETELEIELGS